MSVTFEQRRDHMMKTKQMLWIPTAFTLSIISLMLGCASSPRHVKNIKEKKKEVVIVATNNVAFYAQDKTFDAKKAKQAYLDLMARFNYPIYDQLKTDAFKVTDFGLGDFAHVGMGSVAWINENYLTGGYAGTEIFLLPGQMIAEYKNEKCDNCPAKRESWLVRYGSIYSFTVESTLGFFPDGVEIPKSQKECAKANNCKLITAGKYDTHDKIGEWHFIMGGEKGAIVTQFSTFQNKKGTKFSNPKIKN